MGYTTRKLYGSNNNAVIDNETGERIDIIYDNGEGDSIYGGEKNKRLKFNNFRIPFLPSNIDIVDRRGFNVSRTNYFMLDSGQDYRIVYTN